MMRLFVGNLPYSTTSRELGDLFASYGAIDAIVPVDPCTSRGKGFGFVTIDDDQQAELAINELHYTDFGGRVLKVGPATPRPPKHIATNPEVKRLDRIAALRAAIRDAMAEVDRPLFDRLQAALDADDAAQAKV